jgi:ribosomal protein S18 acetylase RimI-like enzyme
MNLKFVPMTENERAFFIHVHHTAYRDVIERQFGWDEALQDEFANKAFNEGGMKIVYFNDQKVGVVGWQEYPDYLWLKKVFLLPEYQRSGIGSQIVRLSISNAQKMGKELRLQTLKENINAKKLYERFGFVVTDATDTHWKMALTVNQQKQERAYV